MTAKKSFLIILRLVFVLFSLQFIRDAFYKWDGYSYYMRFIEFLPDLSLAFVLWTIIGVILAFALWLIAYGFTKISPRPLKSIRLEHIIVWVIFIVLLMFIKRTFFGYVDLSGLIGLSHFTTLVIGGVLVAVVIWLGRRYIEKILYGLDSRITPVVWLFAFLLVLAVPLSVFKGISSESKYISEGSVHVTSSDEKRPNIVLVTMDALTALDMQVYGYNRPTTPFISEWAKDAIVFNRAYSSANWTTPGVMSMMTGQRVWTHRAWYQAYYHPVSNYKNNLARVLKDYGYAVYGFVQNHYAHPEILGIGDTFLIKDKYHTFWVSSGWWLDELADFFVNRPIVKYWIFTDNLIAKRINSYYFNEMRLTLYHPKKVYNRFLEYISETHLRDRLQQPFFAWLHLLPPHDPFLSPKPYMGLFGDAEKFNSDKEQNKNFNLGAEYKPEKQKDVDILRKRYDEFILYSDKQFELFLSRLAETIDMSNTIIILSSDHGESFSQGFLSHSGPHLYESLVHIPLIIRMHRKTNGKIVDMPVELTDIAPTILELAGIPVPAWMEGRSLLPLIKGKSLEPRPVFSMELIKNRVIGNPPITKGTIAVWDGDYKLIYYLSETRSEEDKKTLLFNLRLDPDETLNLSQQEPKITQSLIKLINENLSNANKKITQFHKN